MGVKTIITCDVCGKQKGEVNHWWLVGDSINSIGIAPWNDKLVGGRQHICGQECVLKIISEWMNKKGD